jgi:hypothetical protein
MKMTNNDESVSRLRHHLTRARQQSVAYGPESLPEREAVLSLMATEPRAWWEGLSPEESYLLFEISPDVAARAPVANRAQAYCAGLVGLSAEWWGMPNGADTATAQRMVGLGKAVAACLRDSLQLTTPLHYLDGEANAMAQSYGWSTGDLAAAIAAQILAVPYDATAATDVRVARRAELASLLR